MSITREQVAHAEHIVATHTSAVTARRAASGACIVLCNCDLCEHAYALLDRALGLEAYAPAQSRQAKEEVDDGKEGA